MQNTHILCKGLYHGSGVAPLSGDGSVRVVCTLVGARHGHGSSALDAVGKPVLCDVGGGDGDGAEGKRAADTTRVGADARRQLLEVVDSLKHLHRHTDLQSVAGCRDSLPQVDSDDTTVTAMIIAPKHLCPLQAYPVQ